LANFTTMTGAAVADQVGYRPLLEVDAKGVPIESGRIPVLAGAGARQWADQGEVVVPGGAIGVDN